VVAEEQLSFWDGGGGDSNHCKVIILWTPDCISVFRSTDTFAMSSRAVTLLQHVLCLQHIRGLRLSGASIYSTSDVVRPREHFFA
jgi:hypothetical protein